MIEYIEIKGFKSIKEAKLILKPINIFIGGNGVGKSNFVSFFKLLNAISNQRLQRYVQEENVDNILYFGRKTTEELFGKLIFKKNKYHNNAYYFSLAQKKEGGLFISHEACGYDVSLENEYYNYYDNRNIEESVFANIRYPRERFLKEYLFNLQVFHFHDTSNSSFLRKPCDIGDYRYLKQDGRNLPAFLYFLSQKEPKAYKRIVSTIKNVAPYIDNFILEPSGFNESEIELRWVDNGDLNSNFSVYQLSDGTLRFIALATLLMQPNPPEVIVIDEPELGLHPYAIGVLAGMIQSASAKSQIIIGTQSPGLISHFTPENIIVMDKDQEEKQTVFNRLSSDSLNEWLQDYSLGEMWERNMFNAAQPFMK